MTTSLVQTTLVHLECGGCGAVFGMSEDLYQRRRRDHETWWCPRGCARSFRAKSEAEELRDALARERARLDQEKAEAERLRRVVEGRDRTIRLRERQVAGHKAVATKLRRRIAGGVCPCCHVQFKDLKQHMTKQHPRWNPQQAADAIAAKEPADGPCRSK